MDLECRGGCIQGLHFFCGGDVSTSTNITGAVRKMLWYPWHKEANSLYDYVNTLLPYCLAQASNDIWNQLLVVLIHNNCLLYFLDFLYTA